MKKRFWILASLCCLVGCSDDSAGYYAGESSCGDGRVSLGEQCDDGNKLFGDGCSESCKIEFGYECPSAGGSCHKVEMDSTKCGNQTLDSGEICDDGNTADGDGCSSVCNIEDGYRCPSVGKKCVKIEENPCGNGVLDENEVCDDGNAVSGDGCLADCKLIDEGYRCPNEGQACIPENCGNEIVDENEECDAGENAVEYDFFAGGCTKQCKLAHYCGDGIVDAGFGEQCDASEKDTSSEYNGCTINCMFGGLYCGDGKITHKETCDDGNSVSGDGCNSDCHLEPGFLCSKPGEACVKVTGNDPEPEKCGNQVLDSGETCDDGNKDPGDGCSAACQIESGWMCPDGKTCHQTTCGDGKIEGAETCEDGNDQAGDGCSDKCQIESGWACPDAGKPCYAQMCGDGIVAGDEECDDKNMVSGDGCSRFCRRESGFHCDVAGQPCVADSCGDGVITGDEVCDEGSNKTEGCKGCKSIAFGWKCDVAGQACTNDAVCGNGVLEGAETCDETSECCVNCNIQPHCLCDSKGQNCAKGSCGNSIVEAGEECDDGNMMAGDGCDPICKHEAVFFCKKDGSCSPICGDGITVWEAGEECDDGNLVSGDGCSSACTIEDGFLCTKYSYDYPDSINLPATFRDFRGWNDNTCLKANNQKIDGCITPEEAALYGGKFKGNQGHPDFERENVDDNKRGIVAEKLGDDGLPVFVPENTRGTITTTSYNMWYRSIPGINQTVKGHITLNLIDKENGTYYLNDQTYYPLNGQAYGKYNDTANNYHFTTHIQTYFKYTGNTAALNFMGDDDVWVFVNGKRAIDIGGCHNATAGSFKLSAEKNENTGHLYDKNFELYEGGIYSISFFQAERHTDASHFELTLTGFLNMGESSCDAICGDGLIRGNEECDIEGHTDDDVARKSGCVNCKFVASCGNGVVEGNEQCDGGEGCSEDCKYLNNQCGDGVVQSPETCDEGEKNGTEESSCRSNCQLVSCGNGVIDPGEDCDDGNTSDMDNCTSLCKKPVCGDKIVQGWLGEACDDGINDGSYGGCGLGCTYFAPRCGDAIVDSAEGEECDDGTNSGAYGTCGPDCKNVERCGDGIVQSEYERCDDGEKNGTSESECSIHCRFEIN